MPEELAESEELVDEDADDESPVDESPPESLPDELVSLLVPFFDELPFLDSLRLSVR
nr:hypothetical protein [Phytoactinopolyspora halophila]